MLLLFDIDGTLLRTSGAGIQAMLDALRELHPSREISIAGVEVAGRLDTLIWREVAQRHGLETSDSAHAAFRACYARHLRRRLERPGVGRVMPGVPPLLEALSHDPGMHLGLVTGNYAETGRLKIAACGLDPAIFLHNAFAEDGPDRRSLPPVAMRRFRERHGRESPPQRTIVIGDTPHDVDCARASGCVAVAVATGDFSAAALAAHEPAIVLESLEDTPRFLQWLRSIPS